MYYHRNAEDITTEYLQHFRIVGIMGPRQSGKSTMIKHLLKDSYSYITFDKLEHRHLFYSDPEKFLALYNHHIVFDEVQLVPELFPALKVIADENPDDKGRFVLTGSGQFLLSKKISESLAGRIGLVSFLPMQYAEVPDDYRSDFVTKGGYPELVTGSFSDISLYFDSYLNTYLQKDLRQMLNVTDLSAFTQLVRLLAVRVAQPLNLSDISKETGITVSTLSKWVSVLEASYIIFLLRPFHKNFGKRLVKTPKVYFYDNGLLSFLTGIDYSLRQEGNTLSGSIFENMIISEVLKSVFHNGIITRIYFMRTHHGKEVDLIIEFQGSAKLIEIKSSHSYKIQYHKTMEKLSEKSWTKHVVYKGETMEIQPGVKAWNFNDFLLTDLRQF